MDELEDILNGALFRLVNLDTRSIAARMKDVDYERGLSALIHIKKRFGFSLNRSKDLWMRLKPS